jgi:thiol-disulfide isomerase/thioredoxin
MKTKNLFKVLFVVAITSIFSCSSSEDEGDGDGGGNGSGVSSITIASSSLYLDLGEQFTFTVKTNEGVDVTSSSTILVDNSSIAGSTYTPAATGEYAVKATYESLSSSEKTITVLPVLVSITIEADNSSVNLGDSINYSVIGINNDGNTNTITGAATVFVNGSESLTGSKYIPGEVGTVNAYATYDGMTAAAIDVDVADAASTPSSYNRRALIEDYTGTWCGYCTRVAHAIDLVEDATDNVVVVATHVFNGDPLENNFGLELANNFDVTSLPTAYINRAAEWNFPETDNVAQVTNLATGNTTSGISIKSALGGNNLSFIVNTGFAQNTSGAKVVVLLLENGILFNQTNYYPEYYGGADPIVNFEHNHVLRYSFTNVLGDAIPVGETSANNTYSLKYDFIIPSGLVNNPNNIEIVAMLVDSNNQVINVNKVAVGQDAAFD